LTRRVPFFSCPGEPDADKRVSFPTPAIEGALRTT
jgi:hypothetical protein